MSMLSDKKPDSKVYTLRGSIYVTFWGKPATGKEPWLVVAEAGG